MIPAETRARAVITHAHDPHDAAPLLDVLGLTEETL